MLPTRQQTRFIVGGASKSGHQIQTATAKKMSLANEELDESQITAMDLPLEFKVNLI